MKTTFSVGKKDTNDIVMKQDSSISGHHCDITRIDENTLLVKDKSTYGTFVNGTRIVQKEISPTDTLIFGEYQFSAKILFDEIKKKTPIPPPPPPPVKTDYSEEFRILIPDLEAYWTKKDALSKPDRSKDILKAAISLVILIASFAIPLPQEYTNMRAGLVSASAMIVGILFLLIPNNSNTDKNEAIQRLQAEYEDKLVCPKCKAKLLNYRLAYWKERKKCSNTTTCGAEYFV